MAEFDQKTPQIFKTSAQDSLPFLIRKFRKCHLKVPEPGFPLTPRQMKPKPGEGGSGAAGNGTWHEAEASKEQPGEPVLDEFFNAPAHPWYFHILSKVAI